MIKLTENIEDGILVPEGDIIKIVSKTPLLDILMRDNLIYLKGNIYFAKDGNGTEFSLEYKIGQEDIVENYCQIFCDVSRIKENDLTN